MRYFLHLAYDGTNYCGWQVQANSPSVQQTINEALFKLLQHEIKSMGCGRTDTGVHAKDFYMHVDIHKQLTDTADFLFRLNCVLPDDITVYRLLPMHDKAHARFDATERTYEYYVHFDKSPFVRRYAFYQGYYHINWQNVLAGTEFLKNIKDFTSLCLPSEDFKTNVCHIKHISWDVLPAQHLILKPYDATDSFKKMSAGCSIQTGEVLRFTITGNRFLRGMVRRIVGTLLMLGKEKLSVDEFCTTVEKQQEFRVHYLAPPNGLFLSKIVYPYWQGTEMK